MYIQKEAAELTALVSAYKSYTQSTLAGYLNTDVGAPDANDNQPQPSNSTKNQETESAPMRAINSSLATGNTGELQAGVLNQLTDVQDLQRQQQYSASQYYNSLYGSTN